MEARQIVEVVTRYGAEITVEAGELVLYDGDDVPASVKQSIKARKSELIQRLAANDQPLATKLQEHGLAVGLEVDGQVVAWIFADETAAASRPDLAPAITATEAEALADCDGDSIRAMIGLKQALGGWIEPDGDDPAGGPVRCADCQHFRRKDHPHLGRCSIGVKSYGAAGLWDNDRRHCTQFREQSAGPAK